MLATPHNRFQWWASNISAPETITSRGTVITASGSTNTYGSVTQILSAATVANDVYGVLLNIDNITTASSSRNALMTIVADPAGGTAWGNIIPDLLCGNAGGGATLANGATYGFWYYFPLWIKAGSSIGAKLQGSTASQVGAVGIWVFGQPSRPEMIRVGAYVDAFGPVSATSLGTAVTPGNATEGAWTQLGSNTAKDYWWTQAATSENNTAISTQVLMFDVAAGDGSNKDPIFENMPVNSTLNECFAFGHAQYLNGYKEIETGTGIYARLQAPIAPDTGVNCAAYCMGG